MADLESELAETVPSLASAYAHLLKDVADGGPYVVCRSEKSDTAVSLFDSQGRTLCAKGFKAFASPGGSPAEVLKALKGNPAYGRGFSPSDRKEFSIAYPVKERGAVVGIVRLSRTLAEVKPIHRITNLKIAWVLVSSILFSIAVSLFFSKHIKQEKGHE